jgi:hypothetical protein
MNERKRIKHIMAKYCLAIAGMVFFVLFSDCAAMETQKRLKDMKESSNRWLDSTAGRCNPEVR